MTENAYRRERNELGHFNGYGEGWAAKGAQPGDATMQQRTSYVAGGTGSGLP